MGYGESMEDYINSDKAMKMLDIKDLKTLKKRCNEGLVFYGKGGKGNPLKFKASDIKEFMEGVK
jgi:phage pi2 protein 07